MVRHGALDSFVVRIWLERGGNGEPIWRGHVRHVQSEQEAYFRDLRGMNAFLERVSGEPGPKLIDSPETGNGVLKSGVVADTKRRN